MKMSPVGRKRLIQREGKRLKAYRDTVGVWTIGVGHTSAAGPPEVTPGLMITEVECDQILARDLVQYEDAVNKAVTVRINQNQFDALTSFCFNIGTGGFTRSMVVKRLNGGDTVGAADAMLMWNKPPEIIGRRQGERTQFLEPISPVKPQPPPPDVPPVKPPKPKNNTGLIIGTIAAGTATAAAAHKQGMSTSSVFIAVAVVIALVIGGMVLFRKLKG